MKFSVHLLQQGGENLEKKIVRRPLKAIRAKCLDCCCGIREEVKLCPVTDCPLYAYRFGKDPKDTTKARKVKI